MREAFRHDSADPFGSLLALLAFLRGPDGCPWDRAQTLQDHLDHLREEASEAQAALGGEGDLGEEAGDLLLCALFFLVGASESLKTDEGALLARLHAKLVSRHPHVFGEESATTPEEAVAAWERAKAREG